MSGRRGAGIRRHRRHDSFGDERIELPVALPEVDSAPTTFNRTGRMKDQAVGDIPSDR